MTLLTLETPRLLLRPWRDDDVDAFAAMFDDPKVMAFLMPPRGRMSASVDADRAAIDAIVGHIGFEAHFTPAVEIGWRLASVHWGKGYATEGARASLEAGFTRLGLAEIVSLTVPANTRSRRVMERIGMTRDPADDFDHPRLAEGDPLRRHVLYRIGKAQWERRATSRP